MKKIYGYFEMHAKMRSEAHTTAKAKEKHKYEQELKAQLEILKKELSRKKTI